MLSIIFLLSWVHCNTNNILSGLLNTETELLQTTDSRFYMLFQMVLLLIIWVIGKAKVGNFSFPFMCDNISKYREVVSLQKLSHFLVC